MTSNFLFLNKESNKNSSIFIIAEIGINHGGKIEYCKELIQAASHSGADAVKLQTVNPDESYVKGTPSYKEFVSKQLSDAELWELVKFSNELGVVLFSTPGDFNSLERVVQLEMPLIKISSGLMTNYPLIAQAAKTGLPLIISTGMAQNAEIDKAVKTVTDNGGDKVALLKCTSIYPSPDHLLNLDSIRSMIDRYKIPIGYSDHTLDDLACLAAVAGGALIIEKHFTLDRTIPGADHAISMEPHDFKVMVEKIRRISAMRGSSIIGTTREELEVRDERHRCLIARTDIVKGELFTGRNVGLMRPLPGKVGLAAENYEILIGKKASRHIKMNEPINHNDVE